MKNLKDFFEKFRLICCDTWGEPIEAWFECVGQMNKRGLLIPEKYEYHPGLGNGTDKESYWYELYEATSDEMLVIIGEFLFRYCRLLKHFRKDY